SKTCTSGNTKAGEMAISTAAHNPATRITPLASELPTGSPSAMLYRLAARATSARHAHHARVADVDVCPAPATIACGSADHLLCATHRLATIHRPGWQAERRHAPDPIGAQSFGQIARPAMASVR